MSRTVPPYLARTLLLLLLPHAAVAAHASELRVRATLAELPRSPRCEGRVVRVVTRYRLEKVLAGALRGDTLFVVHRCPELPRGSAKVGRGLAGALRPGQTHLLTLEPYEGGEGLALLDRWSEGGPERIHSAGAGRPSGRSQHGDEGRRPRYQAARYQAARTDPAPGPPRVAIVFHGGAGSLQRLDFDGERVTVGRSADSDVYLNHPGVAPRHLLLEVQGDTVAVRDLGTLRGTKINGRPAPTGRAHPVTATDKIEVGPYELRVSLFLPEELDRAERAE